MAKVTSKRQVTIPKAIADRYRIRQGDEVEFVPAGDVIRIVPPAHGRAPMTVADRLALFDAATGRQREREQAREPGGRAQQDRGWTREEVYTRGRTG